MAVVVVGVAGWVVVSEIEKKVCKVIGKYINRFVLVSHRPCVLVAVFLQGEFSQLIEM